MISIIFIKLHRKGAKKETQIGLVSYFMFITRDLHQSSLQSFHCQPFPHYCRGHSLGKEDWNPGKLGRLSIQQGRKHTFFVLVLQTDVPHR